MDSSDIQYVLALQHIPNLGDASAKKLIAHFGSAKAIFKEKKHNLLKVEGIENHKIMDLNNSVHMEVAEREMGFIEKNNVETCYFQDTNYPERLKHCLDGPILLFQRENIDFKNRKILSLVGTRRATTYGVAFCEEFIAQLAPLNTVIVSGVGLYN